MTMLSFRVDEDEAAAAQQCAEQLGIDRSELLRTALHDYLIRMASERDALIWAESPATEAELSLAEVADWGPAEDWSDWGEG